ncbi:MAG: tetratricopeptide repeat protein [Verrucomicrobia bacterium]|nr:tetratricopeptide repeat protein [Verrucomicrobiota bacterium]
MSYTHLTDRDFDEKLREMGNYLWDLEQAADLASAHQQRDEVDRLESKIRDLGRKAALFTSQPGPHRLLAAYVAGLAARMIRDWRLAAGWFERVVDAQPENADAWLELTWCLAELEDWPRCIEAARQVTRLYPKASAGWGNLALALRSAGDLAGARQALAQALALDPEDPRNLQLKQALDHTAATASAAKASGVDAPF